jgi:4-hydroxybenzoyl-CoA reductase subunit beta
MMRLPTFEYKRPKTLEQAAALFAEAPTTTRLIAGGTDLFPNLKRRHQHAERLLSLRALPNLRGVDERKSKSLRIGAMTTLTDLIKHPLVRAATPSLVRAAATVSTPVLRNMGTIGGNLCLDTRCTYYNQNEEWRRSIGYCMKEVGETCWVAPGSPRCWAISASDTAPLLCALDAQVHLVSVRGERVIPLTEMYRDDGIQYLNKEQDEILTEISVPVDTSMRATYWKLRRRGSIDFPVLGVGAAITFGGDGRVKRARIHFGGVHSFPIRAIKAEDSLVGERLDAATIAKAARLAQAYATPMDNTDFTLQWRREMALHYVDGALREIGGLKPRVQPNTQGLFPLSV